MTDSSQQTGIADLHMHTDLSDGKPTVQALLNFVAIHRPQLDVIAITDHDKLDSALWAVDHAEDYAFDIVPGIEVSTRFGHVLALWVTTPIPYGLDLKETATAIREAGGISVLAHPFHFHLPFVRRTWRELWQHPEQLVEAGLDAVEVHNAGVATPFSNWLARRMAQKLDITVMGDSDAHNLGAIATGTTHFPGHTADDLRHALLNRQTIAKGRPWHLSDYVEYLRHDSQWTPVQFSETQT